MISPMTSKKFEILVLNQISQAGLKRLPEKGYKVSKDGKTMTVTQPNGRTRIYHKMFDIKPLGK